MKIEDTLKKCKEKFMNNECVVGIGLGKKNGNDIIVIMVSKKDASIKKIPRKFENIEIEIKEVGKIVPLK